MPLATVSVIRQSFDQVRQLLLGAFGVWQRRPGLRLLALIGVGLFAVYKLSYPTHTHRYRITVNVDVDGQLHSGSSGINRKAKILPDAPPYAFESVGEAVFVDMGFGRMNGGKMARYS